MKNTKFVGITFIISILYCSIAEFILFAVWLANADLWGGSKHPIIDMLCAIIFLGAYIALIIISMKKGYYRCNIWALKDKIILVVCWLLALPIGVLINYLIVFGIFSML